MRSYYNIRCPECGYKFKAIYGRKDQSRKEKKMIQAIETSERNDEVAQIYKIMDKPRIELYSIPFLCRKCRELFNYDVSTISNQYGAYSEKSGCCPVCKETAHLYILEEIFADEEDRYNWACPKCKYKKLTVDESGFLDLK